MKVCWLCTSLASSGALPLALGHIWINLYIVTIDHLCERLTNAVLHSSIASKRLRTDSSRKKSQTQVTHGFAARGHTDRHASLFLKAGLFNQVRSVVGWDALLSRSKVTWRDRRACVSCRTCFTLSPWIYFQDAPFVLPWKIHTLE